MTKFRNGDRVFYVSGTHGVSSNNPLKGTLRELAGTVVEDDNGDFALRVRWDNGEHNTYQHKDMAYADDFESSDIINPNRAFKMRKIPT